MKQLMFSLATLAFISLSSFTTKNETFEDEFFKICRYRIYNSNTGETLGYIEFNVLSESFNCGGQNALDAALHVWQQQNP